MIYIGIDPGEHTGLAVWNSGKRSFDVIETLKIHKALDRVLDFWRVHHPEMCVVFEDARQRTWVPPMPTEKRERGRCQGAGSVKRDSKIWEEFLTDFGIPFEAHKPQVGGTKWSADYFARVTGYTKRCSEHARDAALLVFQRK